MYWPIGSPKVYSHSRHAGTTSAVESEDGTEREEDVKTNGAPGRGAEQRDAHTRDGGPASHARTGPAASATLTGEEKILAAEASRGGSIFVTVTRSRLSVWQTKPVVALASIVRSAQSLKAYGGNTAVLLRPDALIAGIKTSLGFLITYTLFTDPSARVFQTQVAGNPRLHRRDSADGNNNYRRPSVAALDVGAGEGEGIREVSIRFRIVIRIDAGISSALALDDELVVATQKPPAIQCIRWVAEDARPQTKTELLGRMGWIESKATLAKMLFDRPMKLTVWITSDGRAYAVQRPTVAATIAETPVSSTRGFCFHRPESEDAFATSAAVSPRFSLIAIGRADGSIDAYTVKDYAGNIPMSHRYTLPMVFGPTGRLTFLSYSPDGYCLFAGYEKGWAMWSVYGKPCANTFQTDGKFSQANDERWLRGVRDSFWIGGGCELALICWRDNRIYVLDMARNSVTGCFTPANISRGLLQTSDSVVVYRGHEVPDLTAVSSDFSLWQVVQIPSSYLVNQWPIKAAVVSPDGRYIAVAGRRGLAHYGVTSGRWKTFDHSANEFEFSVRGGMCWYQHVLIVSVEVGRKCQVRLYSREKALDFSHILHTETLASPAVCMTVSGADSLLVYTHDNTLLHYIIAPTRSSFKLVPVGRIGFQGVIRAPARVRAVSWVLPEDQLVHGDPSQDVARASVVFLVDGKLVLLQPSTNELGELKYDMLVLVQNAEFYMLARDQSLVLGKTKQMPATPGTPNGLPTDQGVGHSLRDSLWYFDGASMFVWSDVQDVLASAPAELGREVPASVRIALDFHPVSALITKGIMHGLDAEVVQRRDVAFSHFRHAARTQLFLPELLRAELARFNSPAALHLAAAYGHLPYLPHALEILLHTVLDSEVDAPPWPPERAVLPAAVAFLASFPSYLDVVVNCTRKTELRSWRTLLGQLPPVPTLFEQSLAQGRLKTAAGFLLVLHALGAGATVRVGEFARLLRRAGAEGDWELCRELARFLVGIDASGDTLRAALAEAALGSPQANGDGGEGGVAGVSTAQLRRDITNDGEHDRTMSDGGMHHRGQGPDGAGARQKSGGDYFSAGHRATDDR